MRGAAPPTSRQLLRVEDRVSFLYLERCTVSRSANAVTASNADGTVHIPAATLSAVLLGPGTRITHHAVMLLADCSVSVVWVGENGIRFYAHGSSLARSTRLLEAQAAAVSNTRRRLQVARAMYGMRFPDEAVDGLTMQQLRGREGARVRSIYRREAERTGVEWVRRDYDPDDLLDSDPINQALSVAHTCLYGVVHAVIVSMGCAAGLGFVHTGHARSLVYDMADLYKAEVTIPIAFDVVAEDTDDVVARTRRQVRDALRDGQVLARCARDLKRLLLPDEADELDVSVVYLWDDRIGQVAGGVDYTEFEVEW